MTRTEDVGNPPPTSPKISLSLIRSSKAVVATTCLDIFRPGVRAVVSNGSRGPASYICTLQDDKPLVAYAISSDTVAFALSLPTSQGGYLS
jgi:hypothetical protein